MTLEELQNEVIRLTEENRQISSLKTELETATQKITDLQTHNQKLFLRVTTQEEKKDPEPEPIDILTFAEDLASKLYK